ncbi:MAG: class GN sortase [Pseudomonadota bacterium]
MTVLLAVGAVNLGQGLYLPAKAAFAQFLLQRAWQRGEAAPEVLDATLRPWPWADTYPVARLTGETLSSELFVLSGGSGRTLAFGPGHLEHTVLPGDRGNSVIAGHRDTHFRFLADMQLQDRVRIDRRDGSNVVFEVVGLDVVDSRHASIALDTDTPTLTLVTCYPFDAIEPGGPMRYVVTLQPPR